MAFKNIGLIIKHDASTVKNTADHVYSYLQKNDCSILLDESAENIISCENNDYVSRNYIGGRGPLGASASREIYP